MRIEYLVESFEENLKNLKKTQAKQEVLQRAFSGFDDRYNKEFCAGEGAYHYIPVDLGDYVEKLVMLHDYLSVDPDFRSRDPELPYRPVSFVEVGCGLARNLFVTIHGGLLKLKEARGFDISAEYVDQAKRYFFLDDNVEVGDALTHDYSRYDVVYFARPFSEPVRERKFEKRLIAQLRPGCYIISYLAEMLWDSKQLQEMEGSCGTIWKKKKGPKTNGRNGKTVRNQGR